MKCADPNMERGRLRMQANRVARHPLLAPPSVCARRAMEPETVTEAAVARLRRVARHLLVAPPSDCTPTEKLKTMDWIVVQYVVCQQGLEGCHLERRRC